MLTKQQVEKCRALFKEQVVEYKGKLNVTFKGTLNGDNAGYISTALVMSTQQQVVVKVQICNSDEPVLRNLNGQTVLSDRNVLKSVAHELTHCLQVNSQRMKAQSYAFNEIVAETTAVFALGLQYTSADSVAYVWNYFSSNYCNPGQELRADECEADMVQAIETYVPQVQDLLRKHGLLK